MKYSVLLLYPDYLAECFGHDTFYTFVEARNAIQAVQEAQKQVLIANGLDDTDTDSGDFAPLLVTAGHNHGLNWSSGLPGSDRE